MKPIDFISGKRATVIAVALLSVASLAGCGSDNNNGDDHPPPGPTTVIDAFYTIVAALTANSPDDTEAVSIEATAVTAPEDSEPQPLG